MTIFGGCVNLKNITIPNSVEHIGECAFNHCWGLQSVVLPRSTTNIGQSAFYDSSLHVVSFPPYTNGVIEATFFGECRSLSNIDIPSTFTYINSAFKKCYSLENVIYIPNVSRLVNNAFENCKALRKVIFSNSVKVESSVFFGCVGLTEVDFSRVGSVPTLSNTNAFNNTSEDLRIIVPDALYEDWIAATNWSSIASKIVKASEA